MAVLCGPALVPETVVVPGPGATLPPASAELLWVVVVVVLVIVVVVVVVGAEVFPAPVLKPVVEFAFMVAFALGAEVDGLELARTRSSVQPPSMKRT